jgi:hypothetical protein
MRKLARVSVLAEEFSDDGDADFSAAAQTYRRERLFSTPRCSRNLACLISFEPLSPASNQITAV